MLLMILATVFLHEWQRGRCSGQEHTYVPILRVSGDSIYHSMRLDEAIILVLLPLRGNLFYVSGGRFPETAAVTTGCFTKCFAY